MLNHHVRIVAGRFKGYRLKIIDQQSLRPTSGRIRETLFNWIGPDIVGMRVLDLFAGSGALGFEALSRGAATVTFVEKKQRISAQIRLTCHRLELSTDAAHVVCAHCFPWLKRDDQTWDLVFVDPPFGVTELYGKILNKLQTRLSERGLIYLEYSKRREINFEPYKVWKQATVGEVSFALLSPDVETG